MRRFFRPITGPTRHLLRACTTWLLVCCHAILGTAVCCAEDTPADKAPTVTAATIDGTGLGWVELGADDFENANCDPDTWTWMDGVAHCTGTPTGVFRSKKQYANLELVLQWRHLTSAGNSGVFLWSPEAAFTNLQRNKLPQGGIEIQVLDHGYRTRTIERTGKAPDWFTTHGDVFAVGTSKMSPFPPLSPNGSRSFPRKELSRPSPAWNHYYVRAINGEVRLWVNGEEVSGGRNCEPRSGYLCLESEGAPVEFRNMRIRELP